MSILLMTGVSNHPKRLFFRVRNIIGKDNKDRPIKWIDWDKETLMEDGDGSLNQIYKFSQVDILLIVS